MERFTPSEPTPAMNLLDGTEDRGSTVAGRFIASAFVAAAILGAACAPKAPDVISGTGGAGVPDSGLGGSSGGAAATGGGGGVTSNDAGLAAGGSGAGGGGAVAECQQSPTPLRQTGTTLELAVDLVFDGKPFVFGETNVVSSTANAVPLNIRFYLSKIELSTTAGGSVPVDIVDESGAIQPYGLFFYNAEDPAMQKLRVRAPAGTYTGLKVELGLPVACGKGDGAARVFPLSSDSQMTWPHLLGSYLSLRYDGLVTSREADAGADAQADAGADARADAGADAQADAGADAQAGADGDAGAGPRAGVVSAIHMGGDIKNPNNPGALVFRIAGALSIPATGGPVAKRLQLAMDQVFKGATAPVDISDYPFASMPEMAAGERLRRTGADLPLFVLGP